jgi:hypothetical protein
MANSHEGRPLRLTLRTLLAWLDDTLPAAEVRQIGNQVTESAFAKELVEKIQRVTRRRRLTVPPSTGPDATDPNLVASYLDNELSPEQIAEYEKRCLTSDVHLAEVASCHQILSMIGQKAKVPAEARHRMYRLVRGRESVSRDVARTFTPAVVPERAVAPIPAWSAPSAGQPSTTVPSWALPVAAGLLVALMAASAWMLAPSGQESGPIETAAAPGATPAPKPAPATPDALANAVPLPPTEPVEEPAGHEEPPPSAEAPAPPAPEKPAAAPALVAPGDGLALRWDPDERSWRRLVPGTTLNPGDRIVGLAPFWTELAFGPERVILVGPAEIRVETDAPDGTPRFELAAGRVLIRGGDAQQQAIVLVDGTPLTIGGIGKQKVGLERRPVGPSAEGGTAPGVRVYTLEGALTLKAGASQETRSGAGILEFIPPDKLSEAGAEAMPGWVSASGPAEIDRASGEAFRAYFKPDSATIRALVEAVEADEEGVRKLAVEALGSIGDMVAVLQALNRQGDAQLRRAAIGVLRTWRARDEETRKRLHDELGRFSNNNQEWVTTVEGLLDEPTAEEAAAPATYTRLVKLLDHPDVGVRQLALDRLMALTGRDALGYDPDDPRGASLKAWQDLVRNAAANRNR